MYMHIYHCKPHKEFKTAIISLAKVRNDVVAFQMLTKQVRGANRWIDSAVSEQR